ncbi:MAG: glycoside hydrolase [Actinomycetota bacterium]|nr:glycoside hydrolase [Actinomycetota bacterium]
MSQRLNVARLAPALLLLPVLAAAGTAGAAGRGQANPATAPVFRQYHGPSSPLSVRGQTTGADAAGEPSLGYDARTGSLLFMANKNTYRVSGFDPAHADKATWTDVTDPVEGAQTSDPILWTDSTTGRTFVNQLELQGGSLQAYTDDAGKTYTHSTMGGSIGLAFDHQSVATGRKGEGGPYPAPVGYPNYVYYCTNDLYAADCAVSLDGGLNFLVANQVYASDLATGTCRPLFGHVKTDPRDGTVYLAPEACNGRAAVFVSKDNTFSWTSTVLTGAKIGDSGHPSLAVGRQDGAVYLAYGSADGYHSQTGRTHVSVSFDHGSSWVRDTALGADLGLVTSRFPVVVAGDRGRAAVAFLGSKTDGDPNETGFTGALNARTPSGHKPYAGVWDLYVSFTADGGRTWRTTDATPHDPVQVGPVCTIGTTCTDGRNLLDFNDMVLDGQGRVAIAMADGYLSKGDTYLKGLAKATIVRQVRGPSLYAR